MKQHPIFCLTQSDRAFAFPLCIHQSGSQIVPHCRDRFCRERQQEAKNGADPQQEAMHTGSLDAGEGVVNDALTFRRILNVCRM